MDDSESTSESQMSSTFKGFKKIKILKINTLNMYKFIIIIYKSFFLDKPLLLLMRVIEQRGRVSRVKILKNNILKFFCKIQSEYRS